MKNFFSQWGDRLRKLMEGRYGTDELSEFLLSLTLILFLLSLFLKNIPLYFLAVICICIAIFRMTSTNMQARQKENDAFRHVTGILKTKAKEQLAKFSGRRYYRYFKCPACGQEVRVPKGKGHIRITCPKCRTQFDRRT